MAFSRSGRRLNLLERDADYGIVGDLFDTIPEITSKIK